MGLNDDLDPMASATRGAVRGALDWTKDQVVELARKLRDRRLAFVQSEETISLVLEERRGEEWKILKRLLKDKDLRVQVSLGLVLRRLERDPERVERLLALRTKILRKFGTAGLRAAQLAQGGIVGIFLMRYLGASAPEGDIRNALETLLRRVEEFTAFVQVADDTKSLVRELTVKVLARSPHIFIILGHGEARAKARKVLDRLLKSLPADFGVEIYDTGRSFFAFVGRKEGGELRLVLPTS